MLFYFLPPELCKTGLFNPHFTDEETGSENVLYPRTLSQKVAESGFEPRSHLTPVPLPFTLYLPALYIKYSASGLPRWH